VNAFGVYNTFVNYVVANTHYHRKTMANVRLKEKKTLAHAVKTKSKSIDKTSTVVLHRFGVVHAVSFDAGQTIMTAQSLQSNLIWREL
jgi:hypothetical protein